MLNGPPGIFCGSNDTTLASCGRASFENILTKRNTYFGPKPWIAHLHRINTAISEISVKWTSGIFCGSNDIALASCRRASFENILTKRHTYFGPKPWITPLHRIKVGISKISVEWTSADTMWFQRRHTYLMWTCQFREYYDQTKNLFRPKIMNCISPQDKGGTF